MSDAQQAVPKEQLLADLQAVVADAEALLRATAGQGGPVSDLRAKVQANLDAARATLEGVQSAVADQAKAADDYVRAHPWQAVGIAAGVGVLVGLLLSRR